MGRVAIQNQTGLEARAFYAAYPHLGTAAENLVDAVYSPANPLPLRVREAARMRIACINDCPVCRSAHFPGVSEDFYAHVADFRRHPELYSRAEQLAMEYAERFAEDHLNIDDAFFTALREEFDDEMIAALTISVAYFLAFGRLTQVLRLDQVCAL